MPKTWAEQPHDVIWTENLLLKRPTPESTVAASWSEALGDEPDQVPRHTEESLRKFVLDYLAGEIFLSTEVRKPETELQLVFLPVAFGAFADWPEEKLKDIGVLYARMSKALPRGINGNPMFTETFVMHKDDWARASGAIRREQERLRNLEI